MNRRKRKWLALLLTVALTLTAAPTMAFASSAEAVKTQETPETEGTSKVSETPETEGILKVPETPETEGTSKVPETPETEGTSKVPETPETEGTSAVPETPETEGTSKVPETSGTIGEELPQGTEVSPKLQGQEENNLLEVQAEAETEVAKVGDTYYNTLEDAFAAIRTQGTVELVADAILNTRILIGTGKDITLDLGSYTVKSDGSFFGGYSMLFENRGTFTVTGDGTIDATEGANPYIGIENKNGVVNILSGNITAAWNGIRNIGGTLNISGGTISNTSTASNGEDCAVYASSGSATAISGNAYLNGANTALRAYGAYVTLSESAYLEGQFGVMLFNSPAENTAGTAHSQFIMTGGTVNARYGLALSGNNTQSALCSAQITGGMLTAADETTAIYWPMEGELTVGGSAVVKGGTGIEAKMGTINITGGTITGTGSYLADEPYAGGSQAEGSALLAASQMYGASSGQYATSPNLTVNITGGTLSSNQGNAVTVYNTEDTTAQSANVSVSGGTLNAASERAGVYAVNAGVQNNTELKQENGVNSLVSSQSQTSVNVSSAVAAAAVDASGNTSYYTDVSKALSQNTESADDPVDIYILKNSEINSEALESEHIRLTTASGVELTIESSVDGMKVSETVNPDGSKTYALVKAYDTVFVDGKAGNDSKTGETAEQAVKTLERALELAADDGTIYICGEVTVDSNLTVDGARIERAESYTGKLISVSGKDAVLTLSNTVIDGKNNEGTTNAGYLVFVTGGGTVNVESKTELINNHTTAVYVNTNSFLNMNGGAIKGNTTPENWGGAGIYTCGTTVINGGEISENRSPIWGGGILAERGTLTLNGGEIRNNSAENGAGVTVNGGAQALLDGASITGNRAANYGAGVYVQGFTNYDNKDTVFEMKSGVISGNVSENATGAGIFAYYYSGSTIIRISGGTIKDNTADMGSAVSIYGINGSAAYPKLELSGSPEIIGDIFYQNDYDDGYVIHVTGEFTPVHPIEITRSNNIYNIPAVVYENDMTPNREDFSSGIIFEGFIEEGQNLLWAKASIVYFYNEAGDEYRDYRHGVVIGETIDTADVPVPSKAGYTFDGWYEKGAESPWDFASDTVQGTYTKLYESWKLNVPTVSLNADNMTPHIGSSATLTAVASHDLDGVTYTYEWYKDGERIEGAVSDKLTVSEAGAYCVKVTASDGIQTASAEESAPLEITIEDHIFSEKWETDGNSHWKVCTVCGVKSDAEEHSFQWVIDKEATETTAGEKHEGCTVCGYSKETVTIPATGSADETDNTEASDETDNTKPSDETNNTEASGNNQKDETTTPKTGDNTPVAMALFMMLVSGAILAEIIFYSKKRKYNR